MTRSDRSVLPVPVTLIYSLLVDVLFFRYVFALGTVLVLYTLAIYMRNFAYLCIMV